MTIITLVVRVLGDYATFPWKGSFHEGREFCLCVNAEFPVPATVLACIFGRHFER